jgi:aryl-alcohol dehydrogenase-like predicted oxidoreductase
MTTAMNYRRLGRSGLKVSELALGSWITYGNQLDESVARECLAAAHDAGVNFFDNAEVYAKGRSETIMGEALRKLGWRRESYVVSTKFYWGLHDGPNQKNTLNRKYLMQAIDGSRSRLQLDYVDLVFCHRPDPETPIEETVQAMHDIIAAGKALYWGTSEWGAGEIAAAWEIAGDGAAAVQPVSPRAGRAGICARRCRLRARHDDVEPARLGTSQREVQRRRPRRFPGGAQGLRVACRAHPRARAHPPGQSTRADRR